MSRHHFRHLSRAFQVVANVSNLWRMHVTKCSLQSGRTTHTCKIMTASFHFASVVYSDQVLLLCKRIYIRKLLLRERIRYIKRIVLLPNLQTNLSLPQTLLVYKSHFPNHHHGERCCCSQQPIQQGKHLR